MIPNVWENVASSSGKFNKTIYACVILCKYAWYWISVAVCAVDSKNLMKFWARETSPWALTEQPEMQLKTINENMKYTLAW